MYLDFTEIVAKVKNSPKKRVMAVAAAEDAPVIDAVVQCRKEGLAELVLVGDSSCIKALLRNAGQNPDEFRVVHADTANSGQIAVDLVKNGEADFLMKGLMDTKALLGPLVKEENGLRTGRVMSHLAFNKLPGYHKLIVNTDGGMVVYPTLEDKKSIIENAAITLRAMGYDMPKIAVLAGVEKVNPKMVETTDAHSLMQLNRSGKLAGCVVEGPVSYDVAMNREIAQHKGVSYRHCGDYDVLVAPNLAAGNILGKSWTVTAGSVMAGVVVGAKVPVVLTSRGSTAEEKYLSIALAALTATGDAQ